MTPEPASSAPDTPPQTASSLGPASLIVLLAGLGSSALALGLVYVLEQHDMNVMGWYASYILPAGALLVGLVAASGYGIGSWASGVKITGRLLLLCTVLLAASYFGARYLEFRLLFPVPPTDETGTPLSFWTYFDFATRSFAWEEHGRRGEPLGAWGYGLRILEVAGFVGGGVLVPVVLRSKPYCDSCQRYRTHRLLGVLLAGVPRKSQLFTQVKEDLERAREEKEALERAQEDLGALFDAAAQGDLDTFRHVLERCAPPGSRRSFRKSSAWVTLSLIYCKRCQSGWLQALYERMQGNQLTRQSLGEQPVSAVVVAALGRPG